MSKGIWGVLEGFDDLGSISNGDWEWTQLDMYYDRQGRIFRWYSSSGCSCNSIGEDYDEMTSLQDFEFGRKDEALRAVRAFVEHEDQTMRDQAQILMKAIRECRGEVETKFIEEGHPQVLAGGAL